MTEHAEEVINLLLWFIGIGGVVFLALSKWAAQRLLSELSGIKSELEKTNDTLSKIKNELQTDIVALERRHEARFVEHDRRIVRIEAACQHHHAMDKD